MSNKLRELFNPGLKYMDIKLTEKDPCKDCETYKTYTFIATMGSIAERQFAELPESCSSCLKRLRWESACINKLYICEQRLTPKKKVWDPETESDTCPNCKKRRHLGRAKFCWNCGQALIPDEDAAELD